MAQNHETCVVCGLGPYDATGAFLRRVVTTTPNGGIVRDFWCHWWDVEVGSTTQIRTMVIGDDRFDAG